MAIAQQACSREHFEQIASSPLLPPALRLARAVNALRALTTAVDSVPHLPRRQQTRQSMNVLLYLGATLYEALEVLDHLGPDLGALPIVRERLIPLRRDQALRKFKQTVLWPLRSSVVFHFDPDVLPKAFGTLAFERFVFASHSFAHDLDRYYELADFALIPAAFADGEYASFIANYQRYLHDSLAYSRSLCVGADAVLTEVAMSLGFHNELIAESEEQNPSGAV